MERRSQKKLLRGAFLRISLSNILVLIAFCACGIIDNLFVGRMLGKDALAAVGFFSPVTVAVGLCYVVILGTQVLTGNLVGAGKKRDVNRLFSGAVITLSVYSAIFAICCFVLNRQLAALLGADGEAYELLCDYIKGYAPGIFPQVLVSFLTALCTFNNELKRSYFAVGAMIVTNVAGDMLLIGGYGLFGIGLASTISSAASLLVLIPGFAKKDKLFRFRVHDGIGFDLVLKAAARGLPSLMLTCGVIIRNYCLNYSLSRYAGAAGVAVAGIMATVSSLVSAVPSGGSNAYAALAGICFGENDRESLIDLSHIAMRIGTIACAFLTGLTMLLSNPLAKLFLPADEAVQPLAARMFVLAFTCLVPNVLYNILLQAYRAQNRMVLVNVLSFAETASMGVFVLFAIQPFGTDAVWLSNTIIDVLCLIVVLISVVVYNGRIDFSMSALLKLPDSFGAKEGEFMTFSVVDPEDVIGASEKVIGFCMEHDYDKQTASHVGLCLEEIAGNVLEHGFGKSHNYYADIRVVIREEELTVRVRDNCREFDPRKRIDAFDPDDPGKNIGIRIVAQIAKTIDYYNNAGTNTLIMKF